MRSSKQMKLTAAWIGSIACLLLVGIGCSDSSGGTSWSTSTGSGNTGGTVTATTLLSLDSEAVAMAEAQAPYEQSRGDVAIRDIDSLILKVTEVSLDYEGHDGEDDPEGDSKVVAYEGEMDVDILDLTEVSRVLSCAPLPAGVYHKIRLSIADPRLTLASDCEIVITDIHLTANGRLFVSETFELPAGESYLLILHFDDIHLVERGNGGYVLTPQLRAEIDVTSADAVVSGMIISIDRAADTFVIALSDGTTLEIYYEDALIFLPEDTDNPTGTEDDLEEGQDVAVTGVVCVDSTLTAESVEIL
jgi:hypothetical protein